MYNCCLPCLPCYSCHNHWCYFLRLWAVIPDFCFGVYYEMADGTALALWLKRVANNLWIISMSSSQTIFQSIGKKVAPVCLGSLIPKVFLTLIDPFVFSSLFRVSWWLERTVTSLKTACNYGEEICWLPRVISRHWRNCMLLLSKSETGIR